MTLRTVLALLALVVVAGCDSVGVDPDAYDGVVEVSLFEATDDVPLSLRLVAVEDEDGCGDLLKTSLGRDGSVRRIEVDGIERPPPDAVVCDAIIPASALVDLDLEVPGGYVLEVEHAGSTDLYALDLTSAVPTPEAVRTSTTRLAPLASDLDDPSSGFCRTLASRLAGCDSDAVNLEVADLVVTGDADGFLIETEADLSCSTLPLLVQTEVDGNRVTVGVEGIDESRPCAAIPGPARVVVPYPVTGGQPFLALEVEKDGAVDRYRYACGVAGCDLEAEGDLAFSRPGPR